MRPLLKSVRFIHTFNGHGSQVRALFERFGSVQEVFLLRNSTGGSGSRKGPSGSAFVRFAYKEQALYAIASLGGKHVIPSEDCNARRPQAFKRKSFGFSGRWQGQKQLR